MSISNGIIQPPFTMEEVCQVLGETATSGKISLETLCKSGKINSWSRRKPIRDSKKTPLVESDFASDKYGFGAIQNIEDIFPKLSSDDLYAHKIVTSLKPTGSVTSPFRLSDFSYYKHEASTLMQTTTTQTFDGASVENWCYSPMRDVYNYLNSESNSVYELVDNGFHLIKDRFHCLHYTYTNNGVVEDRYADFSLSSGSPIKFVVLNNSISNPNAYDNLTLSEIGLTDIATFNNYSFGLIITIGNDNYLYNTKFTLQQLYTGQSGSNYSVICDENYQLYYLAQKTNNGFDITLCPFLFANWDSSDVYKGEMIMHPSLQKNVLMFTNYALTRNQNVLTNLSSNTTIKTKLCLCNAEINNLYLNSFFYKITNATDGIYSCEFKNNQNVNDVKYNRYARGVKIKTGGNIVADTIDKLDEPSGIYPTGHTNTADSLMKGKVTEIYRLTSEPTANDTFVWNIRPLLEYVASTYLWYGITKTYYSRINSPTAAGDDELYQKFQSKAAFYKKESGTATSFSEPIDIPITIRFKTHFYSVQSNYTGWSFDNTKITDSNIVKDKFPNTQGRLGLKLKDKDAYAEFEIRKTITIRPAQFTYTPKQVSEGDNPAEMGLYVQVGQNQYKLTTDTTPQGSRTYYERSQTYKKEGYDVIYGSNGAVTICSNVGSNSIYVLVKEGNVENEKVIDEWLVNLSISAFNSSYIEYELYVGEITEIDPEEHTTYIAEYGNQPITPVWTDSKSLSELLGRFEYYNTNKINCKYDDTDHLIDLINLTSNSTNSTNNVSPLSTGGLDTMSLNTDLNVQPLGTDVPTDTATQSADNGKI